MTGVTDHPDWGCFVRAMRAAPDDDTVRLVAADWLEEYGAGEWAEYVRVACEFDKRPRSRRDNDPRYMTVPAWERLRERLSYLFRDKDVPPLPAFMREPVGGVYRQVYQNRNGFESDPGPLALMCVRGFISEVRATSEEWLAHGDAVYTAQPVTRVVLTTAPQPALADRWRRWLHDRREMVGAIADEYERVMSETSYDEFCLSKMWPGVSFTLPAEPSPFVTLEPRAVGLSVPVPEELLADSAMPQPLGVIEVPDAASNARPDRARNDRRYRQPNDRGWAPRWPRPR